MSCQQRKTTETANLSQKRIISNPKEYVYTIPDGLRAAEGSGTPCRLTEIVSSGPANATVTMTSGNVNFDYVRFQQMTATGGAEFTAGSHSQDLGGSTGWDIAPYDGASPIMGLGTDRTICADGFPIVLDTEGFFAGPSATYLWSDGSTGNTLTAAPIA